VFEDIGHLLTYIFSADPALAALVRLK